MPSLRTPEGLKGQKVLKAREVWKVREHWKVWEDWKIEEDCGVQEFHKVLKVNKSNEFYKVHKVLILEMDSFSEIQFGFQIFGYSAFNLIDLEFFDTIWKFQL